MDQSNGYFAELVAETYDSIVPYQDRDDVVFYTEMAYESKGPVLELGCGTGRILIPIALQGIEIEGLDLSASMLTVCQKKLHRLPPNKSVHVKLHHGSMACFQFHRQFNLITIPFRAFQHLLTVEDQLACLRCIHEHLNNQGRLVMDLFNPFLPYLYEERFLSLVDKEPPFFFQDNIKIIRQSRYVRRDLYNQILEMEFLYCLHFPDGHTEQKPHRFSLRYLFRYEVEHLLERCGFTIEHLYADFDRSPFGSTYPGELIIVAKKG